MRFSPVPVLALLLACIGFLATASGLHAQTASLTYDVGRTGGVPDIYSLPGQTGAYLYGVNYNGSAAVGLWRASSSYGYAYLWTVERGGIDLGTLPCCVQSIARSMTGDGQYIVGDSSDPTGLTKHAFIWSAAQGMRELAPLVPGAKAWASAISSDGRYVAGSSAIGLGTNTYTAVRWNGMDGLIDLDPISPATSSRRWKYSEALFISGDGKTVVGDGRDAAGNLRAFRWTEADPQMVDLGTLGTFQTSVANGVNTDGSVVVGSSGNGAAMRAFRWTRGTGMLDIGTLGGVGAGGAAILGTSALAVSGDGRVVVGISYSSSGGRYAFRWEEDASGNGTGSMESVQSWMTRNGVNASNIIMTHATAVNENGLIIAGNNNINGISFIARVPNRLSAPPPAVGFQPDTTSGVSGSGTSGGTSSGSGGGTSGTSTGSGGGTSDGGTPGGNGTGGGTSSGGGTGGGGTTTSPSPSPPPSVPYTAGLMLIDNFRSSLVYVPGADLAIRAGELTLNGGHGKPMRALLDEGQSAIWSSGDLAALLTDQGSGPEGLAELGYGFGAADGVTLRLSAGGFAQRFAPDTGGDATTWLGYVLPEATINPVSNLYLTGSAYYARGRLDSHRGYRNGADLDHSDGKADLSAWGWRLRADLKDAVYLDDAALTPFASYSVLGGHRDGFTEAGGSFPVRWNGQSETSHVLRAGVDATRPLTPTVLLVGHLEASYDFDAATRAASGEIIDLSRFSTGAMPLHQFGAQGGIGVEVAAGSGTASLMLNLATGGNNPAAWAAASYRVVF